MPTSTSKSRKTSKKIFVLDTSVILFDHNAIMNFDEHDVAIPITVLEELDEFKKGNDTKNFEAREFIRFLDKKAGTNKVNEWINLNGPKRGRFKVIMSVSGDKVDAQKVFAAHKMDHRILNAALKLESDEPTKKIVLVTKDINLRLKAKALGLVAEDYQTGKIQDISNIYTGKEQISPFPQKVIDKLYADGHIDKDALVKLTKKIKPISNKFYILKGTRSSSLAFFNAHRDALEHIEKKSFYGIKPRNAEQTFALHAIMDDNIKLVSLTGVAGTGKTLLALAGSLEQRRNFKQIYLARPIVPLSNRDIGFLPGDAEQKVNPYMQPLWDNLKYIKNQFSERDRQYKQIEDMVNSEKILVTPLAYIRGRSLSNVIFIVDEAQNLTPHEIKTIITRAGENSKFIFTGDVNQIDTPYLDEQSNGLSYLVDKLQGNPLYAHIALEKGERSELANLANDLL
ncbi:PhoH family protein [Phaeocystidibacter marisrubri]|uniref:PhoH family protein n=1 Tax=Phaeocystidibacter marisrubri TaxID=1577780 RepID=A0A6L3ZIU4_9FLAO|nr:PhoH family protein [Phaeocystidibacter marisrubri]KAB2817834.1 PhoH family protein [Phaeocystidibacter marisrubri]GGH73284.1 phosphate starvation protein PhoH [Phaeocystidibacter marisrubri]